MQEKSAPELIRNCSRVQKKSYWTNDF